MVFGIRRTAKRANKIFAKQKLYYLPVDARPQIISPIIWSQTANALTKWRLYIFAILPTKTETAKRSMRISLLLLNYSRN